MTKEKMLSITIDNKKVSVRPNQTVLEAARDNAIDIPSLCALPHLRAYGACRLCVVEVDGLRGFPTSCTTPVEDGMVIRTDTAEIKILRQEVLKLVLSEHPGSCLFCDQAAECKKYMGTIRKVGVTTGCRYCPNDLHCELQDVVEKVGLAESSYPVLYHNFPVEKYDPFYDRDYNLCVLCGRCVRVCSEVRLNSTLSFKQRGRLTTIGPAFDRSHLDAGCEFCGACVEVCPTGALASKVSKWTGKPDAETSTTCVYCPVGCTIRLQVKNDQVVDALPDYSSEVDGGLICVKGRFAVPEYVNHFDRLAKPQEMTSMGYNDVSWDDAAAKAAEKLKGLGPDDCLFVLSPQLSNEDLFAAQEFARQTVGSEAIAPSPMFELGDDLLPFIDLVLRSEPYALIDQAQAIVSVGFDSRFGYTPIGIATKKAARKGVFLASLSFPESNLDMLAEVSMREEPGRWAELLKSLIDCVSGSGGGAPDGDVGRIADATRGASPVLLIVGPQILSAPGRADILKALLEIREKLSWKVIVAHPYTNLLGMLTLGAFPGLKPGDIVRNGPSAGAVSLRFDPVDLNKPRKVVYLIGEVLPASLPPCDYLIYQNALPTPGERQPDLILPSCLFTESSGSIINGEGKIRIVQEATKPYGECKPDWWIFTKVGEALGKGKPKYTSAASVQAEIKKQVKRVTDLKKRFEFQKVSYPAPSHPSLISWNGDRETFRGIALALVIEGMKTIGSTRLTRSDAGAEKERQ